MRAPARGPSGSPTAKVWTLKNVRQCTTMPTHPPTPLRSTFASAKGTKICTDCPIERTESSSTTPHPGPSASVHIPTPSSEPIGSRSVQSTQVPDASTSNSFPDATYDPCNAPHPLSTTATGVHIIHIPSQPSTLSLDQPMKKTKDTKVRAFVACHSW